MTQETAADTSVAIKFDSGAVAVTDASSYVLVATLYAMGKFVILRGLVGAGGALAHMKITRAATIGGTHDDWLTDAGIAADPAVAEKCRVFSVIGTPYTTAANGAFQIAFDSGGAEYAIYAKKATADTTLQLTGTMRNK